MKRLLGHIFLGLGILALAGGMTKSFGQEVQRYKIRSGIVEYKLSGVQTGSETIYFDRWGMREAKYSQAETKMMNMSIKKNILTLLDGDWTYSVDLDAKTGTKVPTPLLKDLSAQAKREGKDLTDIGEDIMKRSGAKKIGEETFLGKRCDVWEIQNLKTKTWVWQGLALKTEASMMGKTILIEATRVQENVSVPPEKLALPKGVVITEGQNPMEMLKQMKTQMRKE